MLICNFMRVFRNVDDSVQLQVFRNLGQQPKGFAKSQADGMEPIVTAFLDGTL